MLHSDPTAQEYPPPNLEKRIKSQLVCWLSLEPLESFGRSLGLTVRIFCIRTWLMQWLTFWWICVQSLVVWWCIAQELPRTMTKEWQAASNEKAIEQKQNPITGTFCSLAPVQFDPYECSLTSPCFRYRIRGIQRQGPYSKQINHSLACFSSQRTVIHGPRVSHTSCPEKLGGTVLHT